MATKLRIQIKVRGLRPDFEEGGVVGWFGPFRIKPRAAFAPPVPRGLAVRTGHEAPTDSARACSLRCSRRFVRIPALVHRDRRSVVFLKPEVIRQREPDPDRLPVVLCRRERRL